MKFVVYGFCGDDCIFCLTVPIGSKKPHTLFYSYLFEVNTLLILFMCCPAVHRLSPIKVRHLDFMTLLKCCEFRTVTDGSENNYFQNRQWKWLTNYLL